MTRKVIQAMSDDRLDHWLDMELNGISWSRIDRPFSTDLNSLQNAESTLTPEQWARYSVNLIGDGNYDGIFYQGMRYALKATARQRAEALLLTLMKEE